MIFPRKEIFMSIFRFYNNNNKIERLLLFINITKDQIIQTSNNMSYISVLIIISMILVSIHAHLKPIQVEQIKRIMRHPDTPNEIKDKTRIILAKQYYPWVKKQTQIFVKNHYAIIKNIAKPHNLEGYAMVEYMKAIQKYNGTAEFSLYAKKYVEGGLFKGLTKSMPQKKYSANMDKVSSTLSSNNDKTQHIKDAVSAMDAEYRKLFYLRYDFTTLAKKHSVAEICKIMGFSEETYRKRMNTILEYIRQQGNFHIV